MRGIIGLLLVVGGIVLAALILTGNLHMPTLSSNPIIPRGDKSGAGRESFDPGPATVNAGSSSGGQQQ